ncbi:AAA family ATPase [Anabaena cylindrica FACHB-243]|uniref:AAA ATPase n=1 Tax=Anabaena cylindrica (strain ATCC 27899 / PCC 7122) TaxID=272123 RepID=K9ZJY3_ANACC|nr:MULTISPECIES: AAA family ATPase [Anabaena]AFZ59516.1 AAA ATPase [Anabaena cylindrica PCC 7122]MBD2418820.1 AAA family ATPase [Anabaena cylindrica FACHB-243]MBY5283326.1 AAA family ATPase [Anabaena sp. CCAP 1446/1C]MBY5306802.1 AAA family ATPase [Anabaena sp. CCAP 1446/1C]MCM2406385.1 AAA family ATPase [Anabaena sp. CCAP 1446/1C]
MRIKQISVTELFGIFNHVIPLNTEDRITIIYGLNGVGKTAILRLLNNFFNFRFSELYNIIFNNFQIDFDDGSYIRLNKKAKSAIDGDIKTEIIIFFKNSSSNEYEFSLNQHDYDFIENKNFNIPIKSKNSEYFMSDKERYLVAVERLKQSTKILYGFQPETIPEWLQTIITSINIRFIESQRLLNISDNNSMIPSVTSYANELAENIQEKLAEYGMLSQSLDRTFPARLVKRQASTELTDKQLYQKLDEIEEKRTHLINAGLLDKDENSNFQIFEQIDENTKKVLSVYVEDVENKLNIFDNLSQKIELMKRIINQRFSYKQINISKDKGFTFTSNGNSLSPEKLSSGEQHELVMLYELLFKVQPNTLILIDEPELSLHVEWQVNFLKDLKEITKIANIDVLLATHSPSIIHDRWDLTVELKGPQI